MSQSNRPTVQGPEFKRMREHLKLNRDEFAIELGYEGSEQGNRNTIRRFEKGERAVPLPVAKLCWMFLTFGIPEWPSGLEATITEDENCNG